MSIGLLVALSLATGVHARPQDNQPENEAPQQQDPPPTIDENTAVEDLEILLTPMTAAALGEEADRWQDRLQAKAQQIAIARYQIRNLPEGDPARPLDSDIIALQEERVELVDRMDVVLVELEAKGGDAAPYRQYIDALPGMAVDVTDTSAFFAMIRGWLVSEAGGQRWGWNIGKFLLILLVFYFGARIVARFVRHAAARVETFSQLMIDFLGKFVRQILMVIGLIVAVAALEVNIAPLLAAVGAAGFVIAFALQDTLSNFASGLLILAYRPFDVGDVIEAGGASGVVKSVSLMSTHVRSFDNKVLIVPNNDIWSGVITNATASDTRRVDMKFGIGYDDDIEKAKGILESLIRNHPLVLADPEPSIQLNELADSSVNFICRPWTKTGDYWTVYWDITKAVKEEFDRNEISIPYPQRDVHVYQHTVGQS